MSTCIKFAALLALISVTMGVVFAAPKLPEGTTVPVQLQQELFSGRDTVDEQVSFKTTTNVSVPGQGIVIPQGSIVIGKVYRSHKAGIFGQPGKISFIADYVLLDNGDQIPLRHDEYVYRGGDDRVFSILMGGIWLLVNGGNGKAHVGQSFIFTVSNIGATPQAYSGS